MENELIIISEYCVKSHTDRDFLFLLEESGLIEIHDVDGVPCLLVSQLGDLERYSHLYYDLSINIEGIDAIRHLLKRVEDLQHEVAHLRRQLNRFRDNETLFLEE